MAELKTKRTGASVDDFLRAVKDEARRRDCLAVLGMMRKATRQEPRMWGGSIVGFGSHAYTYASGHSGEWPVISFSPRAKDLTLYICGLDRFAAELSKLGRHGSGKACLYIRSLDDVDVKVLERIIHGSVAARPNPVAHAQKAARPSQRAVPAKKAARPSQRAAPAKKAARTKKAGA